MGSSINLGPYYFTHLTLQTLLDQDLHNNKLLALSSLVMVTQIITTQKNKIHGNRYDYKLNFDEKFANTKINLTKIKVIDDKFKYGLWD